MKVLHLSSESSWRGGEQQIAYLIEELKTKGIEPLIAGRPNSKFSQHAKLNNWEYLMLPMGNSIDFKSAVALKKICRTKKVQLLHVHSSRSHGIAYLSYLLGNSTPIVVSRRVDFPPKKNFLSRHKYNIKTVLQIACVSQAIENMVRPVLEKPEICRTIYSGIDHSKFKNLENSQWLRTKYKLDDSTILVGNTSAIAPHKDYFTFIDTAKAFVAESAIDVKFFIIGSGPMEQEIKEYSTAMGMDKYIIFTGFLDNINEVLPSLDVFFISSATEGLGTSIIDAFACKVPVVATEAGGIPEIVKNEETGLTSAVKDVKGLVNQLTRIISDTSLSEKLITNAYQRSISLSKEEMANQYFNLYKEILQNA